MKYLLAIIYIFISITTFSQKIDFSLLEGNWFCFKASQDRNNKPDSLVAPYPESYALFKHDSIFAEEGIYMRYITANGYYSVNKNTNIISFTAMADRTRDERTIQRMKNYMHHERPEEKIISLSRDTLILLELPADTIFYRRLK